MMTQHLTTAPCLQARPPHSQQGFTLIESLIAILIFVIGILGLIGLQTGVTAAQTEARARTEAALLAQEAIGLMWTDISRLDQYAIAPGSRSCAATACQRWLAKVQTTLPQGAAMINSSVTRGANNAVISSDIDLTVTWTTPAGDARRYQTTTTIAQGMMQ